jgi:hypothetical protein
MNLLLTLTILIAFVAVIIAIVTGATIKILTFSGILVGSSYEKTTYTVAEEDSGETEDIEISQIQFCLFFIAIAILWRN